MNKEIEKMEQELIERRDKMIADLHAIAGALQALSQLKERTTDE